MFKYLYGTCRDVRLNSPLSLDGTLMNGGYSTEFFNQGQFADFALANIVKISHPIHNDRYTGKIPVIGDDEQPTGEYVNKLTRFVMLRYSDVYTNAADLTASIEKTGANTGVQVFATVEEARAWVRANTDLIETEPGKFLIREAGEEMGVPHEAEYLVIA